MQRGYICVAGVNPEDNEHIRPVIRGRLSSTLLRVHGGPFSIAALVDLGHTDKVGSPPEVEDHSFVERAAKRQGTLGGSEFWKLLKAISGTCLVDIFGADLKKKYSASAVVPPGKGTASLGCLRGFDFRSLYIEDDWDYRGQLKKKIRLSLTDSDLGNLDLSVTDIRFYKEDHVTPDEETVEQIAQRIKDGTTIIISVGLTRAYPESDPVHWLQVNNIHLEDDPTWNL
jgi:hypothetical protein